MAFAIMRHQKIKGAACRAASIAHTYRERETPNADKEKTPGNEVLVQYDKEKCDQTIEKGRTRSDNVETVEIVMTTSPEWMDKATPEQKEGFKQKSQEFLEEIFGKESIQSVVVHKDEQTEHVHAHVTPIDEKGKLNAKKWFGGKKKLQELQDKFAEKMKDLGLQRGERGSKAKHQAVAKYYARVNAPAKESVGEILKAIPSIPPPAPGQDVLEYGMVVASHLIKQVIEPMKAENQAKTQELQALRRERPTAFKKLKDELKKVREENNILLKYRQKLMQVDKVLTKNPALKKTLVSALEKREILDCHVN